MRDNPDRDLKSDASTPATPSTGAQRASWETVLAYVREYKLARLKAAQDPEKARLMTLRLPLPPDDK